MKVNLFLLCYNEEDLLPNTLKYYRERFSDCNITIFDNYSTDQSSMIAKENGCRVVLYDTNGQQDEKRLIWVRSHMWKEYVTEGWVIMCDMDEWLDITEKELEKEDQKGTNVITTQGFNMVGESKTENAKDIDLFQINKGFYDDNFSKRICFKYPNISMEYWYGAHKAFPYGYVVYSENKYLLRHYSYLGEEYLINKNKRRYERNNMSREQGINLHYSNNSEESRRSYQDCLNRSIILPTTLSLQDRS